jgi:hypothetical protein
MYFSGNMVIRSRKDLLRETAIFAATISVYSLVVLALHRIGVLKPLL